MHSTENKAAMGVFLGFALAVVGLLALAFVK